MYGNRSTAGKEGGQPTTSDPEERGDDRTGAAVEDDCPVPGGAGAGRSGTGEPVVGVDSGLEPDGIATAVGMVA